MMLLKYIFSNFIIFYIVFASTWIAQIMLNFKTGSREALKTNYIGIVTIGKIFIPLYLKCCPYNFLELKPYYFKMILITFTLLIEVTILHLQKLFGPKNLLPAWLKKNTYNYYIDLKDINEYFNYNNECIVCLEILVKNAKIEKKISDNIKSEIIEKNINCNNINSNIVQTHNKIIESENINTNSNIQNNSNNDLINLKKSNCKEYFKRKKLQIIEFFSKNSNYKDYMITPCNHIFHTKCLEPWIEKKLECPFCRRPLPSLE